MNLQLKKLYWTSPLVLLLLLLQPQSGRQPRKEPFFTRPPALPHRSRPNPLSQQYFPRPN